jgi:hypothetical protein
MLAGCGAPTQSQVEPLGLIPSSGAGAPHSHRGASWMSAGAAKLDLLYISDVGTNEVYAYSYPDGKLQGTLTGFNTPLRLCSDKAGDVFITDTNNKQIVEYAHGGSAPIATLADRNELPMDCAVDSKTGNLAVTNYGPAGSNVGDVVIYKRAAGTPKIYSSKNAIAYLFCDYDKKGNLYVSGLTYKYDFILLELVRGAPKFKTITLDQKFGGWGGVQWDGTDLAIGDGASTVYRFAISGNVGTKVHTMHLGGAVNVAQFWLHAGTLIGPDGPNGGHRDVGLWTYPDGGAEIGTIGGTFQNPSGATISLAPQ